MRAKDQKKRGKSSPVESGTHYLQSLEWLRPGSRLCIAVVVKQSFMRQLRLLRNIQGYSARCISGLQRKSCQLGCWRGRDAW